MHMGAPIRGFIAATNINKTVPDYLATGDYQVRPSQATISNAMDVGAPSNFERMAAHWSYEELKGMIRGIAVSDEETRAAIAGVHEQYGYYLDPHGAVGWKAADKALADPGAGAGGPSGPLTEGLGPKDPLAILATAHPAKFAETVEPLTGPIPVPASLKQVMEREPKALTIAADIAALKEVL
jgi:threonine synthase